MSSPDPLYDPENVMPDDGPNPEDTNDEDSKTDQFIEDSAFGLV